MKLIRVPLAAAPEDHALQACTSGFYSRASSIQERASDRVTSSNRLSCVAWLFDTPLEHGQHTCLHDPNNRDVEPHASSSKVPTLGVVRGLRGRSLRAEDAPVEMPETRYAIARDGAYLA